MKIYHQKNKDKKIQQIMLQFMLSHVL